MGKLKPLKESISAWGKAKKLIAGGVNSSVRAYKAVGGSPIFISRARDARIYDIDGNSYVDYVLSWGPLILGHSHPAVVKAIRDALPKGTSYGAPTLAETKLAKIICSAFSSIEKVRLVNSGTEATMSAIRLSRAFAKRDGIVKFEGCYHGHSDGLLVKAGSGGATFGIPDSAGVPNDIVGKTFVLPYNNQKAFENFCKRHWREIACVIVEPVVGNMGVVMPKDGFLNHLRRITKKYGIVLIFDEVITGFRFRWGGVQDILGIRPDLTTLGKIIGGGLPIGAYGGRSEIMGLVSPEGPVYQAGTLSGNPIAVASGVATLEKLKEGGHFVKINRLAEILSEGFLEAAALSGVPLQVNNYGSMLTPFFTHQNVVDFKSAKSSDAKRYARFFWGMINKGFYFPPSQFEASFISIAHSEKDIYATIKAAHRIFKGL